MENSNLKGFKVPLKCVTKCQWVIIGPGDSLCMNMSDNVVTRDKTAVDRHC